MKYIKAIKALNLALLQINMIIFISCTNESSDEIIDLNYKSPATESVNYEKKTWEDFSVITSIESLDDKRLILELHENPTGQSIGAILVGRISITGFYSKRQPEKIENSDLGQTEYFVVTKAPLLFFQYYSKYPELGGFDIDKNYDDFGRLSICINTEILDSVTSDLIHKSSERNLISLKLKTLNFTGEASTAYIIESVKSEGGNWINTSEYRQ